jgi:Proliferating cell nuclear antigen, N-terminal domain
MFEARIGSTDLFRAIISDLKRTCDHFVMECCEAGVSVKAEGNGSSVSTTTEVFLSTRFFDGYRCEKRMAFQVDIERLTGILKRLAEKRRSTLCLVLKAGVNGSLEVCFQDSDGQVRVSYGWSWFLVAGPAVDFLSQ